MFRRTDLVMITIVIHVLALALPLALLQIYDRILPSQSYGTTAVLVIGVGTAIVCEALLRYGRMSLFARYGAVYETRTLNEVFRRLLRADIDKVERIGIASVMDSVRAVSTVRDWWSGSAAVGLYEVPFIALYIGLIAYVAGWLALIPLILFICTGLLSWWFMAAMDRSEVELEAQENRRRNLLWSIFFGLTDIKSRGAESGLSRFYYDVNSDYMTASADYEAQGQRIRELVSLMAQLSTVLVVIFGALQVIDGNLTTGGLSACTLLAGRSINPAMAGFTFLTRLGQIRLARRKVDLLLDLPVMSEDSTAGGGRDVVYVSGKIQLQSTRLADPLSIAAGEIALIESPDQVLASSLLSAIAGIGHVEHIRVRLDGKPVADIPHDHLRAAVCLVTRAPALVSGSILNNLTLFDPRFNQAAVEFSDALGLKGFVDQLRSGILTEIGPLAAETLDDGIVQRIGLIRALVRQPRILLLDHAASALDMDGEQRLADVLQGLKGKTTVVIVSAREKLLAQCDRHIVLREVAHG